MNKELFQKYRKSIIVSGSIIITLLLIYLMGFWFFQTRYVPNTKIGSISISQLSKSAAQDKIQSELESYELNIAEQANTLGFIELAQLDVTSDTEAVLDEMMTVQSPAKWPFYLFLGPKYQVELENIVAFDSNTLDSLIGTIGIRNQERPASENAYVAHNAEGVYQLYDEVYGQQVSAESLASAIIGEVKQGSNKLDIANSYIQPELKKDDEQLIALQTKLDQMQNVSLALTFAGETVTIPKDVIASWISIDGQEPVIETDLIEEYILELNREYAGLFQQRKFNSTYQGTVMLDPGTYGWYIDRLVEAERIAEDILAVRNIEREPVIGGSGYGLDNDIGSSYVEVDIFNQMMTIYLDGEIVLQTAVVTGTPGTNTVPGTYQVWNKEYDTSLIGYNPRTESDYEQPVDYWIAFDDQAQGIHDASWQSYFGGDAYLTNGSLGCINTPPGIMPQVFEIVYHGMPVVIF